MFILRQSLHGAVQRQSGTCQCTSSLLWQIDQQMSSSSHQCKRAIGCVVARIHSGQYNIELCSTNLLNGQYIFLLLLEAWTS